MAGDRFFARIVVPARVESIRASAAFLVQAARSLRVPAASEARFELAIVEAVTNAVKHGQGAADAAAEADSVVVCELESENRSLLVRILDAGPGFELPPASLPGVSSENVAAIPEAGYGLPVIQAVFPGVRTVTREGRFGLELPLSY
jgi:anti-sigma regulatory factor (Ser/Thr protein kinase)